MSMIPFIGFTPDIDPTTPGAIMACNQIVPTLKGIAGAPTPIDAGYPALPVSCHGAATTTRLDGGRRLLAGTQTALYELLGGVFTDMSKAGGYIGSQENVWRYGQYGNVSLATNQTDRIQASITGAFSDIAQAPKAKFLETAAGFVMAMGINDAAVGGDRPDAWWCCNIYDYLTWTPALTNQAAYGYLLDTPGAIVGQRRLGTNIVAYKERSIYIGQYIGPPVIWEWSLVSSDIGALSQECIVDTGVAHLFISLDDFWIFDGSRPRSIGAPVREWFFKNSDAGFRFKTKGYYDRIKNRVWWFFAGSSSGGVITDALIYNVNTNHWGYAKLTIQATLNAITPDATWDSWPPGPATNYENIVDVPFDSSYFDSNGDQIAVFGADNALKTLNGPSMASTIVTGDIGDDTGYSTITSVKPRFLLQPTTAMLTSYTKAFEGDTATVRCTSAKNGNQFDVLASGRYHSMKIDMTGAYEIVGVTPILQPDGEN